MKLHELITKHAWWGKLIGAFFGYLMAGPVGALFGILAGNLFDRGLVEHFTRPQNAYSEETRKNIQKIFIETTFLVMGHIAKVDGRVSENEILIAQNVMQEFRLSHKERINAQKFFNLGKKANFNLNEAVMQLREALYDNPALLNLFINVQYRMAKEDGLSYKKQESFNIILHAFGYAPLNRQHQFYEDFFDYDSFRQSYTNYSSNYSSNYSRQHNQTQHTSNQLEHAYAILEISPTANKQEVKRAYRKLISIHHPDKLIAKGMPEETIKRANEKTRVIRKAYEDICESKGW